MGILKRFELHHNKSNLKSLGHILRVYSIRYHYFPRLWIMCKLGFSKLVMNGLKLRKVRGVTCILLFVVAVFMFCKYCNYTEHQKKKKYNAPLTFVFFFSDYNRHCCLMLKIMGINHEKRTCKCDAAFAQSDQSPI